VTSYEGRVTRIGLVPGLENSLLVMIMLKHVDSDRFGFISSSLVPRTSELR